MASFDDQVRRAHVDIAELKRLAELPTIDDAQLDAMVQGLSSTDFWLDNVDGGQGGFSSAEPIEMRVSDAAAAALSKAGVKVLPRLLRRLPGVDVSRSTGLLRVVEDAPTAQWAALTRAERDEAITLLNQWAGVEHQALAMLELESAAVTSQQARARDMVTLRVMAIDDEANGERLAAQFAHWFSGVSLWARIASRDAMPFLKDQRSLARCLVESLLSATRTREPREFMWVVRDTKARLDAATRARLLAVVDHPELGGVACDLLGPYVGEAAAEAEVPLRARMLEVVARACFGSKSDEPWTQWLRNFGRESFAAGLVAPARAHLASGNASEDDLRHLALVGPGLAAIAPDVVRFLDPKTSPSMGHTVNACTLAAALKSPVLAPALVALLETPFQYEVMNTLAAIGPGAAGEVAALAVPVLERLRFDGPEQASLKYRQGRALTKLRGK